MASTHDNPDVVHEESDVNVRAILASGAGLVVVAVAIHFAIWLMFQYLSAREATRVTPEYPLAAGQDRLPPEPRLQTNPRDDLKALRDHEDQILQNYGWIDRPAGLVRVPIDQAMKIALKRGMPVRPANGKQ
jgi:hypothetical protein